jgi:hypothetical protein
MMSKNEKTLALLIGFVTAIMLMQAWSFTRLVNIVERIQNEVNTIITQHNKQIELLK